MAADDRLRGITAIRDLRPGMKNVTCLFIVIDRGSTNQTKDGSVVRKCRVADRSASICFSLWNEQAEAIESGDILRLTKGYASLWKGGLVLYSGKYGILEKVGDFTMVFSETPDMSDTGQEFAIQASQQQQARGQPSSPSTNSSVGGARGGVNPNSGGNGRTGMGPAINGNRNGNNHMTTVTAIGRPVNGTIQQSTAPAPFSHVDAHSERGVQVSRQSHVNRTPQPLLDPRGPKFELAPHTSDSNFESDMPPRSQARGGRTFDPRNRHTSSSLPDNPRFHPYQRHYSNQCPPGDNHYR